jgi:phage tail protein X
MATLTRIAYGSVAATMPFFSTVQVALAAASSGLALASSSLTTSVGLTLPDITARLAGAGRLAVNVGIRPPSIVSSLAIANRIVTSLGAAIAPPSVNCAATAALALVAKLNAIKLALDAAVDAVGIIETALNLVAQMIATLGSLSSNDSVAVYLYEGDGADLAATLGTSGATIVAMPGLYIPMIVLQSSNSAAKTAVNTVFGI